MTALPRRNNAGLARPGFRGLRGPVPLHFACICSEIAVLFASAAAARERPHPPLAEARGTFSRERDLCGSRGS